MLKYILAVVLAVTLINCWGVVHEFIYVKTDTEDFPKMTTAVQVLDTFERPLKDLTADRFRVVIDGKETNDIELTTYEKSGIGLYIMLCLDVSWSMRGEPMEKMKESIHAFIDDVRPIDQIAIFTFSRNYDMVSDFSNNKSFLKRKIDGLSAGGRTDLYYGAYKSLEHLVNRSTRNGKVMILFGDGEDTNPSTSFKEEDVINLAREDEIPIYSLGYTATETAFLQTLEKISINTRGKHYHSRSMDDLKKEYGNIYDQLIHTYLLNYTAYGIPGDGQRHNLIVTLNHRNVTKIVQSEVFTPPGISAKHRIDNGSTREAPIDKPDGIEGFLGQHLYLLLILLGVIIITVVIIVIAKNNAKKSQLEKKLLEEKHKAELLTEKEKTKAEAERLKRELEETQIKKEASDQDRPGPSQRDDNTRAMTDHERKSSRERTMILGQGSSEKRAEAIPSNLKLEFLVGSLSGQHFVVDSAGASLGRGNYNTIVMNDRSVSSSHANISFNQGRFFITDLNSLNCTFINGVKIQEQELSNGDIFKIGNNEGKFQIY